MNCEERCGGPLRYCGGDGGAGVGDGGNRLRSDFSGTGNRRLALPLRRTQITVAGESAGKTRQQSGKEQQQLHDVPCNNPMLPAAERRNVQDIGREWVSSNPKTRKSVANHPTHRQDHRRPHRFPRHAHRRVARTCGDLEGGGIEVR